MGGDRNMTIEYKDSKRISGLSSDVVQTPSFDFNFSSTPTGWTELDSSKMGITGGQFHAKSISDNSNDTVYVPVGDLGDDWIIRMKAQTVGFNNISSGGLIYIGLVESGDETATWIDTNNLGIFIGERYGDGSNLGGRVVEGGSIVSGGTTWGSSSSYIDMADSGSTVYLELKLDGGYSSGTFSATTYTDETYSTVYSGGNNGANTNSITVGNASPSNTSSGLTYLVFKNPTDSATGSTSNYVEFNFDDLKIYKESSLSSKPTDVQDNSILVEKDTARRYWFSESGTTINFPPTTTQTEFTTQGTPDDMVFSQDGLHLYTVDGTGALSLGEYTLTTAWDISTASHTRNKSFSYGSLSGVSINNDGTKIYVVDYTTQKCHQLDLSTAYNISTATDNGVWKYVTGGTGYVPTGIHFKPDGTRAYVVDQNPDQLTSYTLSTAWDLSTLSYDSVNKSLSSQNPEGMVMNYTGTKIWVLYNSNDTVQEWTLSTAWDLSTATANATTWDFSAVANTLSGGDTNPDDSTIYFLSSAGKVLEYPPTTATWNAPSKTPAEIGDLKVHYDATVGVTASSNSVSAWADQSGNGKTLSSVSNPTRVEAGQNGKDYIDFNSSKSMRASGLSEDAPRPFTMVAVINPRNTSDQTIIRWGQSPYLALYQYPVNTYYISGGSDVGLSDSTLDDSWNAFFMDFKSNADGGTLQINLDTANAVSGDIGNNGTSGSGGNSQPSTLHVGINADNNNWYANCRYAEIIIFDKVLTAYEKEQLYGHLKTKWGLP